MKIIISGVAGFIGSHLAKRFIAEGHEVVGLDNLSNGKISNIPTQVDFFKVDLESTEFINKIPKGCKMILHLAGQSSGEISYYDPVGDLRKNTISTLNLINYGIENNIERFLYASSMSVYGEINCPPNGVKEEDLANPISCYGIGKLASEKYLEIYKNKFPYVSLRMFNVYGPGQDMENLRQGMVSIYLSQALKSNKILVKGSLSRFRDFIYIDDVIESWFRASFYDSALNQKINIGTGKKTSVKELINFIKQITKTEEINVMSETPCDQLGIFSNSGKLSRILGYKPNTSLIDGLNKFNQWAKN